MAAAPFAESKVEPTAREVKLAWLIWEHEGREHPISIAELTAATGWPIREIKAIVERLVVTHRMRIGGRRGEPGGYFMVVDLEDQAAAVRPYRRQIFSMFRRLRVLMGKHALAELCGQLAMSVDAGLEAPGEGQKE
jgi:hypothetical protein